MIHPEDEELHPIGGEQHWQESYYFCWADPQQDYFGLTRIGFRFNENEMDGLVVTIRNGQPEFAYPAVNLKHKGSWDDQRAADGLRTKGLIYKMEEPLKKWRLILKGRNAMDLEWTAYTPAFDYHEAGSDLPPNVAGHHYEQSGRVEGWTRFKGKEREVHGLGQRDKSWGVRDWAKVEGWNWISAWYGEDLSFNIWEGFLDGKRYVNGFIFRDGKNYPVEKLNIRFEWGDRKHEPQKTLIEITDSEKRVYWVTALALGHCPLVKKGLWLDESYNSFQIEEGKSTRRGVGIIEHAWHAGTLGTLKGMPLLLGAARKLLLP